jgi:hypothetical protein
VVAGGNNLQSFAKVALAGRGAYYGQFLTWKLEVEGAQADNSGDNYMFLIGCTSGNGMAFLRLQSTGLGGNLF